MKLATFRDLQTRGEPRIGIVDAKSERVFDLAAAAQRHGLDIGAFASMLSLIDAGKSGLETARDLCEKRGMENLLWINLYQVKLMAPLPEPRQMRDCMSFPLHIRQGARGMRRLMALNGPNSPEEPESEPLPELDDVFRKIPIYYITNRLIVSGPDDVVLWPRYSNIMDYELEFGVVTMGDALDVSEATAADHIFGYTIFNDFSARDQQMIEMGGRLGPAKGKSFNGANALGPWIVTPDEIGDPYRLKAEARRNGERLSSTSTEGMLFSFEEIIAYMSSGETLRGGEFIGSGTLGGGCGLETGRFLEHGDEIELEVERIGVLRNIVERQ